MQEEIEKAPFAIMHYGMDVDMVGVNPRLTCGAILQRLLLLLTTWA